MFILLRKSKKNGKITFEKIEKGYIDNKIYIVIETSHIKEGFSLKINIFQYLEKNGQVHKKNIKEEDLIVKVGNYKDKGGSTTQAIAEVMLGFSTKNYLFYYPLEKESKLYVTLSVDADGNGEADKTVCFNLKEYMYNYVDVSNFWYRESRFELEEKKCFCGKDFTVEEVKNIVIKLRENTYYNKKSIYYYHQDKLFHRNYLGRTEFSSEIIPENERTFQKLTFVLNENFSRYKIKSCIQKISFLAQMYIETAFYTATIELDKNQKKYDPYRGRGFIHLTHKGNEDSRTKNATSYLGYKKHSGLDVIKDPSIISKSLEHSAYSAGWFWTEGVRKNDGHLINLNDLCGANEADFKEITRLVKGATTEFAERFLAFQALLKIFDYENCKNK